MPTDSLLSYDQVQYLRVCASQQTQIVAMSSGTFSNDIKQCVDSIKIFTEQLHSELDWQIFGDVSKDVKNVIKKLSGISQIASNIKVVSDFMVNSLTKEEEETRLLSCNNKLEIIVKENDYVESNNDSENESKSNPDDIQEDDDSPAEDTHFENNNCDDHVDSNHGNIDVENNDGNKRKATDKSSLSRYADSTNVHTSKKCNSEKEFSSRRKLTDGPLSYTDLESNQYYMCQICCAQFVDNTQVKHHYDKNHCITGKYQCDYCEYRVKTLVVLLNHVSSKHKEMLTDMVGTQGSFGVCEASSNIELKQRKNGKKLLSNTKTKFAFCNECQKRFASLSSLKRHKMIHENKKPYVCLLCSKSFRRKTLLEKHTLTHDRNVHKCDKCNYKTHTFSNLEEHLNEHKTDESLPCYLCDYEAKTSYELLLHNKNHERKKCKQCRYDACNLSDLRIHQRKSHANLSCSKCEYVCHNNSQLKQHVKSHNKEDQPRETFFCELCAFTCHVKKQFTYHMLRHSDKTPLSCPYCDYKCSSTSSLATHKLKHAGLKPFLCSDCGRSFSRSSHLKKHSLIHKGEKPFQCKTCGRSFRAAGNLKVHELIHSGQQKQHKCHLCPFACRRRKELLTHLTDQHTIIKPFVGVMTMELSHPQQPYVGGVKDLGSTSIPIQCRMDTSILSGPQ